MSQADALENDIRELRGAEPGELARRLIERGWRQQAETAALREALAYIVREYGGTYLDEKAWAKVYAIFGGRTLAPIDIERRLLAATEAVREPALREHEGPKNAEVAGLDVERLARALANYNDPDGDPARNINPYRVRAERIAAEYAKGS